MMKWLIALLLGMVALVLSPILLNRAPLFDPPGPLARLKAYLTSNRAELSPRTAWVSLRSPSLTGDEAAVRRRVLGAMQALGWERVRDQGGWLRAEVVTPMLHFRDDVRLRLEPAGARRFLLVGESASRIGKADFAANERHLRELLSRLR